MTFSQMGVHHVHLPKLLVCASSSGAGASLLWSYPTTAVCAYHLHVLTVLATASLKQFIAKKAAFCLR